MAAFRGVLGVAPNASWRRALRLVGFPDSPRTTWTAAELTRGSAKDIAEAGREISALRVGSRLQGALRAADTVARLGGDEFGILITGLGHEPEAQEVARKLTGELDASFELEELEIALGGSIGIARYPEDGAEPETLLRHAEVAMYVAKAARDPFQLYTAEQDTYSTDRLALVAELRRAIDQGELACPTSRKWTWSDRR